MELDSVKLKRKKKNPQNINTEKEDSRGESAGLKDRPFQIPTVQNSLSLNSDTDPRYRRATKDAFLFQKMVEACHPRD